MTEPRHEPLDAAVRDALRAAHGAHPIPPFDEIWTAAEAQSGAERHRNELPPLGSRIRRGRRSWAALAAATATFAVALILYGMHSPEPPATADRSPPTSPAAVIDVHSTQPVMWYAPTDGLLETTSLDYTARPAALTYYDPIQLEIRP